MNLGLPTPVALVGGAADISLLVPNPNRAKFVAKLRPLWQAGSFDITGVTDGLSPPVAAPFSTHPFPLA
jgi:hypothetical protein